MAYANNAARVEAIIHSLDFLINYYSRKLSSDAVGIYGIDMVEKWRGQLHAYYGMSMVISNDFKDHNEMLDVFRRYVLREAAIIRELTDLDNLDKGVFIFNQSSINVLHGMLISFNEFIIAMADDEVLEIMESNYFDEEEDKDVDYGEEN